MAQRLFFLGIIGLGLAGLGWLTLRPNPQVGALLWSSASVARQAGLDPAWLIDTPGNILVFVPVGAVPVFLIQRGRPFSRFLRGMLSGLWVSITLELLQALTPTRIPSLRDVFLNTLGAALGAALAVVAARRTMQDPHANTSLQAPPGLDRPKAGGTCVPPGSAWAGPTKDR